MITTQTEFRAALLDPASPSPEGVRNPDGMHATKRFDVYRNNVAVSLTDALETAFPVVNKLVGTDFSLQRRVLTCARIHPNRPMRWARSPPTPCPM